MPALARRHLPCFAIGACQTPAFRPDASQRLRPSGPARHQAHRQTPCLPRQPTTTTTGLGGQASHASQPASHARPARPGQAPGQTPPCQLKFSPVASARLAGLRQARRRQAPINIKLISPTPAVTHPPPSPPAIRPSPARHTHPSSTPTTTHSPPPTRHHSLARARQAAPAPSQPNCAGQRQRQQAVQQHCFAASICCPIAASQLIAAAQLPPANAALPSSSARPGQAPSAASAQARPASQRQRFASQPASTAACCQPFAGRRQAPGQARRPGQPGLALAPPRPGFVGQALPAPCPAPRLARPRHQALPCPRLAVAQASASPARPARRPAPACLARPPRLAQLCQQFACLALPLSPGQPQLSTTGCLCPAQATDASQQASPASQPPSAASLLPPPRRPGAQASLALPGQASAQAPRPCLRQGPCARPCLPGPPSSSSALLTSARRPGCAPANRLRQPGRHQPPPASRQAAVCAARQPAFSRRRPLLPYFFSPGRRRQAPGRQPARPPALHCICPAPAAQRQPALALPGRPLPAAGPRQQRQRQRRSQRQTFASPPGNRPALLPRPAIVNIVDIADTLPTAPSQANSARQRQAPRLASRPPGRHLLPGLSAPLPCPPCLGLAFIGLACHHCLALP